MSATGSIRPAIFLTADWRYLAMLNFMRLIQPHSRLSFRQVQNWIFGKAKATSASSAFFFKMPVSLGFKFHFIAILRKSMCDSMSGAKLKAAGAGEWFLSRNWCRGGLLHLSPEDFATKTILPCPCRTVLTGVMGKSNRLAIAGDLWVTIISCECMFAARHNRWLRIPCRNS